MAPPRVQCSLCTFCKNAEETILHLFVDCDIAKSLWCDFLNNWGRQLCAPSTLTGKQILLGDQNFNLLLNHLIILIKKFIYDSKLKNKIPTIDAVKVNMTHIKNIEKYIAERNNCLGNWEKKWGNLNI